MPPLLLLLPTTARPCPWDVGAVVGADVGAVVGADAK
jgi:hypothetical protein